MKTLSLSFVILAYTLQSLYSQEEKSINVYFFPGQGSDYRVFKRIELPCHYKANFISYPVPDKKHTLREFALTFIPRVDTSSPYVFIGHSLGGMICTELTDTLTPLYTIIISSAKSRHELPFRYRVQKTIPVYKLIPKKLIKTGAMVLQPIIEPDRNNCKETFKAMLKSKEPLYLKRTIHMIITWNRETYMPGIVHIHGTADNTIPIRNVIYNYKIENGSHMMVLTRFKEMNDIIGRIL